MNIKGLLKAYPIAIAAGGALIILSAMAIYRNAVLSDLRADLSAKNSEASRLSENLHNAQKLDAQLTQLADLNQRIGARLSLPSDVAANQQYFYKMESASGVKLLDLRPQTSSASGRAVQKNALTQYSTVGYTVSVQGDFPHLLTFLRNFESGSRLNIVTQATVSAPSAARPNEELSSSAPLSMNLDVQLLGVL